MAKISQKQKVLEYIEETGSVTQLEAIYELGVMRLSDVIFRLKKEGYTFKTEMIPVKTRYGSTHVARYSEVRFVGSI